MRAETQTENYRQLFSYEGKLTDDSALNSRSLLSFSEVTLSPNSEFVFKAEQSTQVILLPLVNGVIVNNGLSEQLIFPNEYVSRNVLINNHLSLVNSSKEELSSILLIQLAISTATAKPDYEGIFEMIKNDFSTVVFSEKDCFSVHIGGFEKNEGKEIKFTNKGTCFVFVIHGITEIENRLLEAGDSLMFLDCSEIAVESFSEESIVLVLKEMAI